MAHHTVVIGAGVSGLTAALTLLHQGYRVTMLERGRAGGESSWAGGGILFPLLPWEYSEPVNALALRSAAEYATWLTNAELLASQEAEYWRCGMLVLDVAVPEQALAWCVAYSMFATSDGPNPSIVTRTDSPENTLWLPKVAQVRNPRLIAVLRTAIMRLGSTLREGCPVVGWLR